jgi:hypothetical protein
LLTWIILNIISTISPFVINPFFHRWAYALPANEAYTILQDIWSRGAVCMVDRRPTATHTTTRKLGSKTLW